MLSTSLLLRARIDAQQRLNRAQQLFVLDRLNQDGNAGEVCHFLVPGTLLSIEHQDTRTGDALPMRILHDALEYVKAIFAGGAGIDDEQIKGLLAKAIQSTHRIGSDQNTKALFFQLGAEHIL